MKYKEDAVMDALARSDVFFAQFRDQLARDNPDEFARAQEKVAEVLESFRTVAQQQDGGFRGSVGETAKQKQLRLDLRQEWLKPIAVIAKRKLRQSPEFEALQLPKRGLKGAAFTASARGMAAAAAVHREALVSYGLPETFAENLNEAVDEYEASIASRDTHHGRRIGATKALEGLASEGRTVLAVMDANVRRWAKGDETLLHAWHAARRIRQRPGPVSGKSESPAALATEAPAETERPLSIA